MKAFAPNGLQIIGTLERIPGRADTVEDGFSRDAFGKLQYDHAGYTEVWWDGQETELDGDKRVLFVDKDGNEWPENKIELRE